jgi:hypothetical protein
LGVSMIGGGGSGATWRIGALAGGADSGGREEA